MQLSRSFKALRAWMALKTEGVDRYGEQIEQNIQQARYLSERVDANPHLERLAPTPLNIVNFRFHHAELTQEKLDDLNAEILQQPARKWRCGTVVDAATGRAKYSRRDLQPSQSPTRLRRPSGCGRRDRNPVSAPQLALGGFERQLDHKRRTLRILGVEFEPTAMSLGNQARKIKPQPAAAGVSRPRRIAAKERLANRVGLIGRYSRTVVGDRDYPRLVALLDFDGDRAIIGIAIAQRVTH